MKKTLGRLLLAVFLLSQIPALSSGETPEGTVNAADSYSKAASLVEGLPKDFAEKSQPVLLNGWVDGPESFLTVVVANKPAIEEFKKAARLPGCNFVLNPPARKTATDELPKYTGVTTVARLVALEGRWHESQGDTQEALEDYFTVLRCAGHLEQQRDYVMLPKLVAVIIRSFAYPGLRKLLLEAELDAATLQKLSQDLSEIKSRNSGLERAFEEEKELARNTMEGLGEEARQKGTYNPSFYDPFYQEFNRLQDDLHSRLLQSYKERNAKPYDEKASEIKEAAERELKKTGDSLSGLQEFFEQATGLSSKSPQAAAAGLVAISAPSFFKLISRHDASLTILNLLATAVSIRIYELKKGSAPENLEALVPEFLPDVPRDPFNGFEPLRYKKEGQVWTLYSVGPDHKDDGGTAIAGPQVLPESVGDIVVSANR
jgi:hypothetical protein